MEAGKGLRPGASMLRRSLARISLSYKAIEYVMRGDLWLTFRRLAIAARARVMLDPPHQRDCRTAQGQARTEDRGV